MLKLCTMCDKKSPLTLPQNLTNSKRAYKITLFFNKTSVFINKIEFLRVNFPPPPIILLYYWFSVIYIDYTFQNPEWSFWHKR